MLLPTAYHGAKIIITKVGAFIAIQVKTVGCNVPVVQKGANMIYFTFTTIDDVLKKGQFVGEMVNGQYKPEKIISKLGDFFFFCLC